MGWKSFSRGQQRAPFAGRAFDVIDRDRLDGFTLHDSHATQFRDAGVPHTPFPPHQAGRYRLRPCGQGGFRSFTPSRQPRCFAAMPPKSKADFIKVSARLTHHAAAR